MGLFFKIKLCIEIFKCNEKSEKGTALFMRGYYAGINDAKLDCKK